jgi:hypothetical protein
MIYAWWGIQSTLMHDTVVVLKCVTALKGNIRYWPVSTLPTYTLLLCCCAPVWSIYVDMYLPTCANRSIPLRYLRLHWSDCWIKFQVVMPPYLQSKISAVELTDRLIYIIITTTVLMLMDMSQSIDIGILSHLSRPHLAHSQWWHYLCHGRCTTCTSSTPLLFQNIFYTAHSSEKNSSSTLKKS